VSTAGTSTKRQERCLGLLSALDGSVQSWPSKPTQRGVAVPSHLDARGVEGALSPNLLGAPSS